MRTLSGRSVRGVLRRNRWIGALAGRAKRSENVRRALIPVLLHFPRLRARLASLDSPFIGHTPPASDIDHPDWPTPLPAEYLQLPASARRVLLDLARAGQPPSSS